MITIVIVLIIIIIFEDYHFHYIKMMITIKKNKTTAVLIRTTMNKMAIKYDKASNRPAINT